MESITAYKELIIAVALLLFMVAIIYKNWNKLAFFWLNFTYSFPFFGKLASLKKNHSRDNKHEHIFSSELQLCNDYIIHYNRYSKSADDYLKAQNYLDLLEEKQRKPMTPLVWLLIIGLIVVEALGFGYVLSGYAVPGASEVLKQYGAYGIGALISVVLVYLTHETGKTFYKNRVLAKIRALRARSDDPSRTHEDGIGLENHYDDKDEPKFIRFMNRIPSNVSLKPSYVVPIITAILIAVVAVGSIHVREEVMKEEMVKERASTAQATTTADVWGEDVPSELQASEAAMNKKVADEAQAHFEKGAWTAFVMLAFIFVFLQIFGILLGYNRGFAGEDSEIAYNTINGFSSVSEFEHYHQQQKHIVSKVAQSKLQQLQRGIKELLDAGSTELPTEYRPSLTFSEYILLHKKIQLETELEKDTLDEGYEQQKKQIETRRRKQRLEELRQEQAELAEIKRLEALLEEEKKGDDV